MEDCINIMPPWHPLPYNFKTKPYFNPVLERPNNQECKHELASSNNTLSPSRAPLEQMEMKTCPQLNFNHSFAATQILVWVSSSPAAQLSNALVSQAKRQPKLMDMSHSQQKF